jgi:hypothetical protein
MGPFILVGIILLWLGVALVIIVIIFSLLKSLKKQYFPGWTFLDYFSVGYVEYLYKRYILGDQRNKKA